MRRLLRTCTHWLRPLGEWDALIRAMMTVQAAMIGACLLLAIWAGAEPPSETSSAINAYRIGQLERAVADLQADRSKIIYLLVANLAGVIVTLFIYIARGRGGRNEP